MCLQRIFIIKSYLFIYFLLHQLRISQYLKRKNRRGSRFTRNERDRGPQIVHVTAVRETLRKVLVVGQVPAGRATDVIAQALAACDTGHERVIKGDHRYSRTRGRILDDFPEPLGRLNTAILQRDRHLLVVDVGERQDAVRTGEDQEVAAHPFRFGAGGILNAQPVAGVDDLPLGRHVRVPVRAELPGAKDTVTVRR